MSHLRIIDSRGERKICREHRISFASKCPKCVEQLRNMKAHADRVFDAFLRCRELNEMRVRNAV
jgi:hypothetical protein